MEIYTFLVIMGQVGHLPQRTKHGNLFPYPLLDNKKVPLVGLLNKYTFLLILDQAGLLLNLIEIGIQFPYPHLVNTKVLLFMMEIYIFPVIMVKLGTLQL